MEFTIPYYSTLAELTRSLKKVFFYSNGLTYVKCFRKLSRAANTACRVLHISGVQRADHHSQTSQMSMRLALQNIVGHLEERMRPTMKPFCRVCYIQLPTDECYCRNCGCCDVRHQECRTLLSSKWNEWLPSSVYLGNTQVECQSR